MLRTYTGSSSESTISESTRFVTRCQHARLMCVEVSFAVHRRCVMEIATELRIQKWTQRDCRCAAGHYYSLTA